MKDKKSKLEQIFITRWKQIAPDYPMPEPEYYIIPKRRFRWDGAWPEQKVAIEIQGGTWSGGSHGRGSGIRRDCEKNNLAVAAGWRVFYATTDLLRDDPFTLIEQIKSALGKAENDG
jgi:very-short-patch-repair endonuclease